jgi:hypothetical protein
MDERKQKCESALALTLPTTTLAFNDNARSNIVTDRFESAHRNLSYRVKYFKNPNDPDEAIKWACADETYGCIWDTLSNRIYDSSKCNDSVGYPNDDCPCAYLCKPASGHENDPASDACKQCIFQNSDISGASCSRDEFSVRPVRYIITPDTSGPVAAGSNSAVNFKLVAADVNDNNVSGYRYARDIIAERLLDINETMTIAGCTAGTIETNGTLYFYSGNSRSEKSEGEAQYALGVKFDDVGEMNITVTDENWTAIDKEYNDCIIGDDNNSRNANGLYGCNLSGTSHAAFVPGYFDVNLTVIPNNSSGFTYLSDNLDVSTRFVIEVTAKNADDNTTLNYNESCYAKDMNLSALYRFNGADYNASNPENLTKLIYDVLKEDNSSIKSRSELAIGNGKHDINNLDGSIFSSEHNGSAVIQLRVNFDRNISAKVNPFEYSIDDINVSDADDINGTLGGTGAGTVYYYARVRAAKDFYDNVTTGSAVTPVSIVVYYTPGREFNDSKFDTSIFTLTDDFEWYLSTNHTPKDGNVTLVPVDTGLGSVTTSPSFSNGRDETVTVNAVSTTRPLVVDINLTGTDRWLIYNPDKEEEPAPFYRVRFIDAGGSEWAGYGKTGHVVETNASRHKSRRLEW